LSINAISIFSAQFMKNYITLLQIIIFSYSSSINRLSNDYSFASIWSLSWKLWLPEKKIIYTQFVHFLHWCNLTKRKTSVNYRRKSIKKQENLCIRHIIIMMVNITTSRFSICVPIRLYNDLEFATLSFLQIFQTNFF